jgi:hypothetical protein
MSNGNNGGYPVWQTPPIKILTGPSQGRYGSPPPKPEPQVIKATPAAAQKCPPRLRLLTHEEYAVLVGRTGLQMPRVLDRWAGAHVMALDFDSTGDWVYVECQDGQRYDLPREWIRETGGAHEFPNTGLNKSWCKCCGEVGHWDWTTQTYSAKA